MSSNTKSSVSAIIKDNFLSGSSNPNRELPSSTSTDKSSLITSLNYNLNHLNSNSSLNTSSSNNHVYQNVSNNFKQIHSMLQSNGVAPPPSSNVPKLPQQQQASSGVQLAPPPVPSTPIPAAPSTSAPLHSANSNSNNLTTASSSSKLQGLTKPKTLDGYVGFANLPNQVYRKAVKRGFEFNLMVIGESGLGKSTFINSLFLAELYNAAEYPGTFDRRKKTTSVESTQVMLTEKGVNLRLCVVDTPGFGESIDNTNCWQPIIDYIDAKYEDFLSAESKINRKLPIQDQRIHCCLHFIAPGHT
jgi:septin 7